MNVNSPITTATFTMYIPSLPPKIPYCVCVVSSFPTFQKQLLRSMLLWTGFCEVITCVELYSLRSVYLLSFNLTPWDPSTTSTTLCDSVAFGSCGWVTPPPASSKIHSSVRIADRFLAPTRKAVVNIQLQIFAWTYISISSVTTRGWGCWVTGRYVRTTWEAEKGLPRRCSHQQFWFPRFPVAPHPRLHSVFSLFNTSDSSGGTQSNLICICQWQRMIWYNQQFFMCLFSIYISSLVTCTSVQIICLFFFFNSGYLLNIEL